MAFGETADGQSALRRSLNENRVSLIFAILAGLTIGAAVAAMSLRNLVHSALCLAVSLVGLALVYLGLGAEFVAWVQILVYVGAVSILIVFAILLTRGAEAPAGKVTFAPWSGLIVAIAVFATLAWTVIKSKALAEFPTALPKDASLAVKDIGGKLVTDYVLPLQVMGLLLTAAMIGAVIIALHEKGKSR